ncbi:MAG: alpha/beta hydrolase [Marmoricola sp.]
MQTTTFTPRPPSRSARFAASSARALWPLEHVIPDGRFGVAFSRTFVSALMAAVGRPAPGVAVEPVDLRSREHGRIKGEWARPAQDSGDGVVLYIHGSGYNLCSTRTHRGLVTRIAAGSGLPVFSTEYRLAPEHVFPAAADDIGRAYAWLLAQGWTPDRILVAGDSAGGHLTLDLALELLRQGRELPAGLVMLSPLADPSFEIARRRAEIMPDPFITATLAKRIVDRYVAGTDYAHPRLTHVVAAHEALPPTLIQAGGAEFLAADAHHIADMLAASGTDVRLEIWPGQMHVFQALARISPEADVAVRRICRFMTTTLRERAASAAASEVTA